MYVNNNSYALRSDVTLVLFDKSKQASLCSLTITKEYHRYISNSFDEVNSAVLLNLLVKNNMAVRRNSVEC